jgi:hypothetical protein
MRKSPSTKNTLLQFPQANAATKNCKRVFFLPPKKEFENIFSPTLKEKKLNHANAPC